MVRAVFFDRDDTLNKDPGYLHDPDQLVLYPEVKSTFQMLRSQGFLIVVVTNQSGIARGLMTREQLDAVHAKLDAMILPSWIDYYAVCTHHPDEHCLCRKPHPQLLMDAAALFQIDLKQSFMVGDRETDIQAGHAAGCRSVLICHEGLCEVKADFSAQSLGEVARWILRQPRR